MNRREFALALGAAPLAGWSIDALAQPAEGKDYTRLPNPVPVAVPGKVEVIEFFGYWCPHCNEFEPSLDAWIAKLPADVNFRRSPVAWQEAHVPYQKLYFALDALGIGPDIHPRVFQAVHSQRLRLDSEAGLATFATVNNIDKAKLADAMKSFGVASKVNIANQLFKSFGIDGVPTLAIQGRFLTSPSTAGGEAGALKVADALIVKARASR